MQRGLVVLTCMNSLMERMSNQFLVTLGIIFVIGYVGLLVIYCVISSHVYNKKHKEARQRVKRYNHNLIKLLKLYEKESKKHG